MSTIAILEEDLPPNYEPPPLYEAFQYGPDVEAQNRITVPFPAVVVETRGLAADPIACRPPTPPPVVPLPIEAPVPEVVHRPVVRAPVRPFTGKQSVDRALAVLLWLIAIVYFFVTTRRADIAHHHNSMGDFWCHSNNGTNLVTMLTFVFFGLGVWMLWWLRSMGMSLLIWPVSFWYSLIVAMAIRGSICGNWGSA